MQVHKVKKKKLKKVFFGFWILEVFTALTFS